mmetsp:Transcript_2045/g.4604  ORF Transcript_2045/g.4604 Transcript_2045/m.4604 type:complete len:233 (-) Transcript_2045:7-705(-)
MVMHWPLLAKMPAMTSIVALVTTSIGEGSCITSREVCANCAAMCSTLTVGGSGWSIRKKANVMCQKETIMPAPLRCRKDVIVSFCSSSCVLARSVLRSTNGGSTMPFSASTSLIAGMVSTSTPRGATMSRIMRSLASVSATTPTSVIPCFCIILTTESAWIKWPVPDPQKATMNLFGSVEGMSSGCCSPFTTPESTHITASCRGGFQHEIACPQSHMANRDCATVALGGRAA